MKLALPLIAASAAFAFVTVPAVADDQQQETTEQVTSETEAATPEADESAMEVPAVAAPEPEPVPSAEAVEEEERICRSIRTDASSRRKTRVCLTREGWRELNNRR